MKHKAGFSASPMSSGLILGAVVCILITLIGVAVCAALISSETIGPDNAGYCVMAVLLVASAAGAAVGAGKVKEKRLYLCLLIAGIYVLLLVAMTALFFDGQYKGVPVTALVIFAGSILPVLLGLNRGKRSNLRKSKIKHR